MKLFKRKNQNLEVVRYNPTIDKGLNSLQLKNRVESKLVNNTKQSSGKSYFRIVFDNTVTFFNLIYLVLFVALILVGSYDNLLFLVIIFLNTLISIIQECKAKKTVEKLSMVTLPKVKVIRNSETVDVATTKLVLDDVVVLEVGNQIPADCIILDGKIDVNESLLTGESNAVRKSKNDLLFAGSFIMSGSCHARVDKIGKDSYIQSIASEAKKFKSPNSNLYKDLKLIIRYIGIGIIPVGAILFLMNFYASGQDIARAVTKTCGAITGMIPAGMFLLVTIALAVGVVKLSRRKTLVQDLFSIEMLARVNVLCLDKTGTITDGTMQVCDVIDITQHELDTETIIANILNAQKTNNATSNALLLKFGKNNELKPVYNMEFASKRKFTATSFEDFGTFAIGAAEFVNCNLTEEVKNQIYDFSADGKRVLLLVHSDDYLDEKEQLPQNTTPIALIAIQDQIREDAIETIEWFKQNNVNIKIISGDNPITVSNIAKRVGVENADACVSLEGLSLQEVEKIATKFTVFGRVSPEQKHVIIKTLKKNGNVVAMTGDGVNDTLALKEADCSIAMADGSDIARGLSNLVLLDSKFSSLPAVVREGRQVINNVQQSSTLFLMKTLFTILLSLFTIVTFSEYPFTNTQMFLLEMFVIGLPSVILALQPNTSLIKGNFIPVVLKKSIPSGLLMFITVFTIVILQNSLNLFAAEEYRTLTTLSLTCTGYMNLLFLCLPLNKLKWFCLGASLFCNLVAIIAMGWFFGMTAFTLKVMLTLLGVIVTTIPLNIFVPKGVDKVLAMYAKNKQKSQEKENVAKQKQPVLEQNQGETNIDKTTLEKTKEKIEEK